jgi:hypothetical protein
MSASEPAMVAPSYHLAGDPFGGLLILRDLSRVSGEPEPSLRGGYVTVPNENSVWRAGGFT